MRKIPSVFVRDFTKPRHEQLATSAVTPGCEWVLAGEGIATIKWDGTACMVRDGKLYKRHDRKRGDRADYKPAPEGWEACQEPDEVTGHWPGWVPVGDGPEDQWHRAARSEYGESTMESNGGVTYELIGPRISGNPQEVTAHFLIPHGAHRVHVPDRSFAGIRATLERESIEGLVFWDTSTGRLAKVKRSDFGLPWPVRRRT